MRARVKDGPHNSQPDGIGWIQPMEAFVGQIIEVRKLHGGSIDTYYQQVGDHTWNYDPAWLDILDKDIRYLVKVVKDGFINSGRAITVVQLDNNQFQQIDSQNRLSWMYGVDALEFISKQCVD